MRIYVRDRPDTATARMPLLGEVDVYESFEAIIRLNAVGTWSLDIPASSPSATLIKPGRGVVIYTEDEPYLPVMSGPIRKIQVTWSKDEAGKGTIGVTGVCDNSILETRVGRATPRRPLAYEGAGANASDLALDWAPTVFDANGNARAPLNSAEFIWALVHENFVLSTITGDVDVSRRVQNFHVPKNCPAAYSAYPADTLWKGFPIHMSSIAETVFALADLAGYRIQCRWQPTPPSVQAAGTQEGLYLNILRVADRSNTVVFGRDAGNLTGYTLTSSAPDATRLYLGGKTTEGNRRFYTYRKNDLFDPAGWKDWDSKDSRGNRLTPAEWSDPWGRQAIEQEWNVSTERYVDARDADWAFQPDPYWRYEAQPPVPGSAVLTELDNQALQFLVENGPTGAFTLTTVNTPDCRYGRHYDVGDDVRVLLGDTQFLPESLYDSDGIIREQVQEVRIASSADEPWNVYPTVGTPDSSETPWFYKQLARVRRRVERLASREEAEPLDGPVPDAPTLAIVTDFWDGGVSGDTWSVTHRPLAGEKYQMRITIPTADPNDPRFVTTSNSEPTLQWSSDGKTWNNIPSSSVKVSVQNFNSWYFTHTFSAINETRFYRARLTHDGVASPWADSVPKLTASPTSLNTSGSVSLNAPSGTYRRYTRFNLTGADTTYGELEVQYLNGGTWTAVRTLPTFFETSWSIPFEVPLSTSFSLRVVSRNKYLTGTVVAVSNTVTVNVAS
ncbi:hypothetical protein AB0C87_24940 [Actinomadura sp. NPDC048021]|uniref:Gp37-like protein n=1 Tax=Actinomadura sp. NPDC048021 TaxID=3155385 RepID=UPI0033EADDC6